MAVHWLIGAWKTERYISYDGSPAWPGDYLGRTYSADLSSQEADALRQFNNPGVLPPRRASEALGITDRAAAWAILEYLEKDERDAFDTSTDLQLILTWVARFPWMGDLDPTKIGLALESILADSRAAWGPGVQ